jgi:hypothetical protein
MLKTFIVTCILIYISIRFKHAFHDCTDQFFTDMDLLSRDVCRNTYDRVRFRDSVKCEAAELRQRESVFVCTVHKWTREILIFDIWNMLIGSYWRILGVLLPTIGLWFYFRSNERMMDRAYDIFKKIRKSKRKNRELALR